MSASSATPPVKAAASALGIRGIGPQADYFTLSGEQSPGLATLISCNAAQDWDIRRGYGQDWATIVPSGEQLSKLEFEVEFWTAEDSAAFDAFAAKYLSRPAPPTPGSTASKAFGFSHDTASKPPYNVASVVVLDVTYLGQRDPGKIAHRISLLEWRAPKPTSGRPDQSTPVVEGKIPTARDKIDQETLSAVNDINSTMAARAAALAELGGGE